MEVVEADRSRADVILLVAAASTSVVVESAVLDERVGPEPVERVYTTAEVIDTIVGTAPSSVVIRHSNGDGHPSFAGSAVVLLEEVGEHFQLVRAFDIVDGIVLLGGQQVTVDELLEVLL